MARDSLFYWISGIIETSKKKGSFLMPQSEMEALIQLQRVTIESLRQLADSQRITIEQMAKSHEEQTAQLNQTIANLNETVEYLKKKLFASSSERSKKDGFLGQMDLFNEAEATMDLSVPEPTLEEAVSGYKRKAKKPKATREESLAGLPVVEVPCTVPDGDRNCPYCNTPMEVIGKRLSVKNCGSSLQKWNGSSMSRKFLAVRNVRKTALPLSLAPKPQARC